MFFLFCSNYNGLYKFISQTRLSTKYEVKGIPTLIMLNKNGDIMTKDGRGCIPENKSWADFEEAIKIASKGTKQ